jgi:hypothetical protein
VGVAMVTMKPLIAMCCNLCALEFDMVIMKGRRGWSGKSSAESLITMEWLPTGQTNLSMIYLIHYKKIYKCHKVLPPSTTIKKKIRVQ